MDNMKLLQYAANAAIDEMIRYQRFAIKFAGQKSGVIAEKKSEEIADDLNEIKTMIQDEKRKQMAEAERRAKEDAKRREVKEAPYVLVVKWNNPIMGEVEYPCKSYADAEKNFETAKREVHNGNVIEAHVYEQGEGQRIPVMGIMSGKL